MIQNPDPATVPLDSRARPMQSHITLYSPDSGVSVEVSSTEPAFQCYTGDGIDLPAMGGMPARGPRAGVAIEPGRYVGAVEREEWRSMVLLNRGEVWGSRMRWRVWRD